MTENLKITTSGTINNQQIHLFNCGEFRLAKLVRQDLTNNTLFGTPMLTTTEFPVQKSVIANQNGNWSQGMILDKGFVMGSILITDYQNLRFRNVRQ